jgi:hypothetical protein
MWNGETESSGTPTQPANDSNVIDMETALQMAVSARDTYKSRLESAERSRDSLSNKFGKAKELLEFLIDDDVDMSGSVTSVDTDALKALCDALNVLYTADLSINVSLSIDVVVPRGTTERDVLNDFDSYLSIDVRSSDDDICEVSDFGIN